MWCDCVEVSVWVSVGCECVEVHECVGVSVC